MPNHVRNIIAFSGPEEEIERVKREIAAPGREGEADYILDFNALVPMPEDLAIVSGSATRISLAAAEYLETGKLEADDGGLIRLAKDYAALMETDPKRAPAGFSDYLRELSASKDSPLDLTLGEKARKNIERYGCPTWYEWRNRHWGTKWNSYDCSENPENPREISFSTAWAPPVPVFEKLAARYPEIAFSVKSSDEGIEDMAEERFYAAGKFQGMKTLPGRKAARDIWTSLGAEFSYRERYLSRDEMPRGFEERLAAFIDSEIPRGSAEYRARILEAAVCEAKKSELDRLAPGFSAGKEKELER